MSIYNFYDYDFYRYFHGLRHVSMMFIILQLIKVKFHFEYFNT